ncbi:MAG: tetratricopeptide repeat protein [Ignavibacteria bacterium]|nr:tetratricopeptide repeat protein [Ignavibacteria bacterium]
MKKIISILIFFFSPIFSQTQVNVDSLINSLETKEDTAKVNLLLKIAEIQNNIDPTKSPQFINEALQLSEQLNYNKGKANANLQLGRYYVFIGKYDEGVKYFIKSIEQSEKAGEENTKFLAMNNLAVSYAIMGKFSKAIEMFKKLIPLAEKIEPEKNLVSLYINIGICFNGLGDFKSAEESFRSSYKLTRNKNTFLNAASANNLSLALLNQNKLKEALPFAGEAYNYSKELQQNDLMLEAMTNLANIYHKMGQNQKAIELTFEGIKLADSIEAKLQKQNFLGNLYLYHEALGNYKESLDYYKKYSAMKDSLLNESTQKEILKLNTQFETERKEKELILKNKEIEEKNLIITFAVVLFLAVSVLLAVIIYLYRKRNLAFKNLVQLNIDIIRKEKKLNAVKAFLSESKFVKLDTREKLQAIFEDLDSEKYKYSSLSDSKKIEMVEKLNKFMNEDKVYLHKDISIEKLAAMMDVNAKYLSQIIHEVHNENFANFVNEYRIKDAKSFLSDRNYDYLSIEGISELSGFYSKQSFNTAFKKLTGMTPSFYKNSALHI